MKTANVNAFGNISQTPNSNRTVVANLRDCEGSYLRSKFSLNTCRRDKNLTALFVSMGKTGFFSRVLFRKVLDNLVLWI